MVIDKQDKAFIKANRDGLRRLFQKRISELQADVFNPETKDEDKLKKVRFIEEFQIFLANINIFSKEDLEVVDNFI